MKAPFSAYLTKIAPALKQLVKELGSEYAYVSVLSTDSVGFRISLSQQSKSVSNRNMTTERGTVVRVYKDGLYSEAAFNTFDPNDVTGKVKEIRETLEAQFKMLSSCSSRVYETAKLDDAPQTLFIEKETAQLPEECDAAALVEMMSRMSDREWRRSPVRWMS